MLEKALEQFEKYVGNYDKSDKGINIKYHHSLVVMDLMGELAYRMGLDKEKTELARLIGLLHDIGRFEQAKKYSSFSDLKTKFDHADEGANYLFEENHIRDFIDNAKYDIIIEFAIRNHNKYKVPENKDNDIMLFTKMIRDMDKVDIYKQCAVNFTSVFKAEEVTEGVLIDFKNEKTIDLKKQKTNTDEILIRLALIFDFNFNESYDILVETDNFDLFLSMIEVDANSEKLWKKIREICFDKINRGVGD